MRRSVGGSCSRFLSQSKQLSYSLIILSPTRASLLPSSSRCRVKTNSDEINQVYSKAIGDVMPYSSPIAGAILLLDFDVFCQYSTWRMMILRRLHSVFIGLYHPAF